MIHIDSKQIAKKKLLYKLSTKTGWEKNCQKYKIAKAKGDYKTTLPQSQKLIVFVWELRMQCASKEFIDIMLGMQWTRQLIRMRRSPSAQ